MQFKSQYTKMKNGFVIFESSKRELFESDNCLVNVKKNPRNWPKIDDIDQVSPIISVACIHLEQSPLRCTINPCQKSLISHKPMICYLTAVAPCCSFLWFFCTYFVRLSIGSDCRDSSWCKTSDIVRITVESNCYTEHEHLALVLAASIRYAGILVGVSPISNNYSNSVYRTP
jgi:hypothetical protein